METTTYQEIQGLARMTVGELREKYIDVFGEETRSYHKEFLRKRIAWCIQVLAEGDLTERARRRAEELADERGWRELSVPAMSLIVFRHEFLMEFSREALEFIAQAKRGKSP